MSSTQSSSRDNAYRSIWNEFIREEFVGDDSSHVYDAASASISYHLDKMAQYLPSAPTHRCTCPDKINVGGAKTTCPYHTPSRQSDPFFALPEAHGFPPRAPSPVCSPLVMNRRLLAEESRSPAISLAELGDYLYTTNSPCIDDPISLPPSPCSSPASSDISLPSTSSRMRMPLRGSRRKEQDEESAYDSSDAESDDEYRPSRSPRIGHKQPKYPSSSFASQKAAVTRTQASVTRVTRSRPTSRSPTLGATRKLVGSKKAVSQRSKPRAKQVDASVPYVVPEDLKCLHCDFVQSNGRLQDFKRHVGNHFRNIIYWECCGVPVSEAAQHGISGRGTIVERGGIKVVGGCGNNFGRKDAYKRHLDDPNNTCVGDVEASWHPGNAYAYKDFD